MTKPTAWPHGAPRVGDRATLSRTVQTTDIALFTELSGDRNPLHYDREAAARTRFGEIVVQGGVTSAILNAVAVLYHPANADSVSLRATATDRDGGKVTETVLRAYKLRK